MSRYKTVPLAESAMADSDVGDNGEPIDAVEAHVQRLLSELELAPPEVQFAIVSRLLSGLAAKLPAGVPAKAIVAAKEAPGVSKAKSSTSKGRGTKTARGEEFARVDSQLALLSDSSDPILAWYHFGGTAQSVREVLRFEPTGSLEAMLRHDRMPAGAKPRGKSREALVDAIIQRLTGHFG